MHNEMYLNEISLEKVAADDYFINGLFRFVRSGNCPIVQYNGRIVIHEQRNKKDIHNTEMFTQITQLRTQNNTKTQSKIEVNQFSSD